MMRFLVAAVLALAASLACAQPKASATAAPAANPPGTHTLNMKDADIQALIATVSEITGKNFIVGPNVQGKVTVISARPMRPDEIYDVFLSVLRVHGYAAIASGSMIKIVPEAVAQQDGSGGLNGTHQHETDELVTQIVPVKHVSATELVPILRPLMPQGAQLIAHPASNSLVISDRAGNVERMISIIQRIDTVSDSGVDVIPLEHASAAEVARILSQL
ncbi:MAG: secretin N-terminal domain-containing protein, partial [Rudaea sp.]